MAVTSDLERLQCIALAVKAAGIAEGRPLVLVGNGKATPTIKPPSLGQTPESVLYTARKPLTQGVLNRCFAVHSTATESSEEVFFYELFNFYALSRPMSFWASPAKKEVVNLPQNTRLTRALLEYIPKEYFAAGTATTAEYAEKRRKQLEKVEKLQAKVLTSRSYLDIGEPDTDEIKEMRQEITERLANAAELQKNIDTFTGFFRRAAIRQPIKEVCGPFLDRQFQVGSVVNPVSPFAVSLSGTGAALSLPPTLLKVWKVTKNCDTLLRGRRLADYRFMDQNSAFMRVVKDQALLSIIDNFGLRGTFNPQILSPVDIFIVRADQMEKIKKQVALAVAQYVSPKKGGETAKKKWREQKAFFRKLRTDSPSNPTSYGRLMKTAFEHRTCLGISLKLPEKVGGDPVMKIVGEATFRDMEGRDVSVMEKLQDSFTTFLMTIDKNPKEMDTIIDKLIQIEYDNFDIRRNIRSWTYPVRFHYDAIFPGMARTMGRTTLDVRFNLMTWDKAGFNGQWSIDQPDKSYTPPSNWTGGFAMKPANMLFKQYVGYNTQMLPRMVALRLNAFHEVLRNLLRTSFSPTADLSRKATGLANLDDWTNVQAFRSIPNYSTYYREAVRAIKKPQIIGAISEEDSAPILRLFRLLDGEEYRLMEQQYVATSRTLMQKTAEKNALPTPTKTTPAETAETLRRKKDALTQEIATLTTTLGDIKRERKNTATRTDVTKRALQYYEIYRATAIDFLLSDLKAFKGQNQWRDYVRNYWNLSLEERGGKGQSFIPNITAHYVAAQFAYFLFYMGEREALSLKRKIFLSVFGLITKSGYKTFETFTVNNTTMVEDIFQARVEVLEGTGQKKVPREEIFRFVQAPYVIFS